MKIRYCEKCDEYTMRQRCKCGNKSSLVAPPKYSPDDKYKGLKRRLKWGRGV